MELRVLDNQVLDWGPLEVPLKSWWFEKGQNQVTPEFSTPERRWIDASSLGSCIPSPLVPAWSEQAPTQVPCPQEICKPIGLLGLQVQRHLIRSTAPSIGPASPWPCSSLSPFPLNVSSLPCGNRHCTLHGKLVRSFCTDLKDLSDILIVWNYGIFGPQFSFHPIKLSL